MSEALELEIERMWLRLANVRLRPVSVFLARTGRLMDARAANSQPHAREVGAYNQRVTLSEFRDDVFFVWEEMRR